MTFHWHDDECGFCPCDEPGGVVTIPPGVPVLQAYAERPGDGPTMMIDFDEEADQWTGHCSEHGRIFQRAANADDHNVVLMLLARHDEFDHDGDGNIYWQDWLT